MSVHDSRATDGLVQPGDVVVFGNSAYSGPPVRENMAAKGVDAVIVQKGVRGRELNATEKAENREISGTRERVEHAFAVMSGQAGRGHQNAFLRPARTPSNLSPNQLLPSLSPPPAFAFLSIFNFERPASKRSVFGSPLERSSGSGPVSSRQTDVILLNC